MTNVDEDTVFDDLMSEIGSRGRFQKRFNYLFNFILVFFATLPYMGVIFMLSVPDHWCLLPGRELTNYTLEEWKTLSIPKEMDSSKRESFSKCNMYNVSIKNIENFYSSSLKPDNVAIVECQYGWEYDTTWYKSSAPSQENWVCQDELNVANSFVSAKIGEVIGCLIFGQLGDMIGRKSVFFITIVLMTIGRCLSIFTANNLVLFLFSIFVGNLASTAVFTSPLVIAMEICGTADRALISMMQCVSWSIAICSLPFIMWAVGDWITFVLITTLPCTVFLFSRNIIIESPRWLASRGKITKCVKELKKIAKINGTKVPENAAILLQKRNYGTEKSYGLMSIFSSWRLAKNSILIIVGWIIINLTYYTLTLNFGNFGGNPFINFFCQALAEFPAYVLGKYSCDRFGRRWTNVSGFGASIIGSVLLTFIFTNPKYEVFCVALSVYLKFSISFAYYALQLQALEIYPTCIRQLGSSMGAIIANAFGSLGPYIVYLGTSVDAKLPYVILSVLSVIGVVCEFFLPETLNMKLPETLKEAQNFGARQKYWEMPKKGHVIVRTT